MRSPTTVKEKEMNWKDVGVVAAKAAPVLGAVLGGPVGAVAGAAGTLLASALGVEADPATVLRKLADPQSEVVLKELEVRRQESLLSWQKEQLSAELMNVTDARAREVALARAGHGASYAGALVSLVVVVGFFWMLTGVMEQERVNEPTLLLLGFLGTAFGSVVNYYLGSSLGSYRKNTLLEKRRAGGAGEGQ